MENDEKLFFKIKYSGKYRKKFFCTLQSLEVIKSKFHRCSYVRKIDGKLWKMVFTMKFSVKILFRFK